MVMMGNKNSGKRKYKVKSDFFSEWNSNMAYILGFTCADGNVHNKTLSWELTNKYQSNYDLLNSFCKSMDSNYPIEKRNNSFRLRITNSEILSDIQNLGVIPNKKKVLKFPCVPSDYLRHFIRGFLDGDGWIINSSRKKGIEEVCVGFSNGSFEFMRVLINNLKKNVSISRFNLRKREKLTKKGIKSITYQLEFYSDNARHLLNYLFCDLSEDDLRLSRKYEKYLKTDKIFQEIDKFRKFGKKWVKIESIKGLDLNTLLRESIEEGMIPRQIATNFGVSLSTIYRWLDKSKIRKFKEKGSPEWSKTISFSKKVVKNV